MYLNKLGQLKKKFLKKILLEKINKESDLSNSQENFNQNFYIHQIISIINFFKIFLRFCMTT